MGLPPTIPFGRRAGGKRRDISVSDRFDKDGSGTVMVLSGLRELLPGAPSPKVGSASVLTSRPSRTPGPWQALPGKAHCPVRSPALEVPPPQELPTPSSTPSQRLPPLTGPHAGGAEGSPGEALRPALLSALPEPGGGGGGMKAACRHVPGVFAGTELSSGLPW